MRKIKIEESDAQRLAQEVVAKAITSIGLMSEKLQIEINPNVKLEYVKFHETDTGYAEYGESQYV